MPVSEISRAHGSYEALLENPEVDVIYNPYSFPICVLTF